ncbi:hypothetical protein [Hyphomicrobium sp. NDB2Meth4]|uniref:hypothetical protein n=1 Tax=Hyphomicrobium sp. NDB2Meth4 TaxID=1892846 RepID=UPI0015C57E3F|nr:hypothetical protein [Hyphomicrobium sp. NDB2Meth4]
MRASDPRLARIIPDWADTVQMIAGVVLGYKGRGRTWRASKRSFSFRARRAHEVEILAFDRLHRGPLSREAQTAFAVAIASVTDADQAIEWIRRYCPAVDADELEEVITDAAFNPRRWTATQFGELLGLTKDERQRLGMRTFRWVGATKRAMNVENRRNNTAYQAAKRAAEKAAQPPKPPSIEKLEPWKAKGKSRRTWYRHKARDAERGTEPVRDIVQRIRLTKAVPSAQYVVAAAPAGAAPSQCVEQRGKSGARSKRKAKAGASGKSQSPARLKARPKGRAAPMRGRASRQEGRAEGSFGTPPDPAARRPPYFEDIQRTEICISLRFKDWRLGMQIS